MGSLALLSGFLIVFVFNSAETAVTVSPSDPVKVQVGNTISFTCEVTGAQFVKWVYVPKNKDLTGNKPNDPDIAYENSVVGTARKLRLINIKNHYCGEYRCLADNNDYGSVELQISLRDVDCKSSYVVEKGKDGYISCHFTACPKKDLTQTWQKSENGIFKDIALGGRSDYRTDSNGSLIIKNVDPSHAGEYRLQASFLERFSDDHQMTVNVGVGPKIDPAKSQDMYGYIGMKESFDLKCEATGDPIPDVVMTTLDGKAIGYLGILTEKPGFFSVKIRTLLEENFDSYKCVASNTLGKVEKVIKLGKAEAPKLVNERIKSYKAPKQTINEKSYAFLKCEIRSGKPYPKFTWYKGEEELLDSDKYTTLNGFEEYGRLRISNPAVSDFGEYKCYAENLMGNVTGLLNLNGYDDPSKGARSGSPVQFNGVNMSLLAVIVSLCLAKFLS